MIVAFCGIILMHMSSLSVNAVEKTNRTSAISVVVSSLGRPNVDGEDEDLAWIPTDYFDEYAYKSLYLYQRTNSSKDYYINTLNGNECLAYTKYIIDNYNCLPEAVIFVHADANRHCPLITNIMHTPNNYLLELLAQKDRTIPGYIALSKVFLNQSKENLLRFNYPMIAFSNKILSIRCKSLLAEHHTTPIRFDVDDMSSVHMNKTNIAGGVCIPPMDEYPEFISTYTSGSFIIAKENIEFYPIEFYKELYEILYAGPKNEDRTCGILEYIWTTIWGGSRPFSEMPDVDRICGPLYFSDISISGFIFYKSEDMSVENGKLPAGYYGHIRK